MTSGEKNTFVLSLLAFGLGDTILTSLCTYNITILSPSQEKFIGFYCGMLYLPFMPVYSSMLMPSAELRQTRLTRPGRLRPRS